MKIKRDDLNGGAADANPDFFDSPWERRFEIINSLIRWNNYSSYLEIGLGSGENFIEIECEKKESVDPSPGHGDSTTPTHRMSSDSFFEQNRAKYDIVFIDGLHHEPQVSRDLSASLACLSPGGAILCHDLNPATREMQNVPREQGEWTGDCWKSWVKLRSDRPDLAMVVVEADYGVGILLPGRKPGPPIDPVAEEEMTWENLVERRRTWLHLLTPIEAKYFVGTRLGLTRERCAASGR